MPVLKFGEIKNQLESKQFSPVYFFQGEEAFFIDELVALIEKTALPEEQRAFNQTVVYGKDIGSEVGKIIDACMRLPMMAERQVVIIKEAQNITGWDNLLPYLKNPTASTILVFAHKHKKLDGRSKFAKELNKQAVTLTTAKYKDYQIPSFIEQKVREANFTIHPKAIQLLVEFLGTDLSKVTNELNKLFLVQKQNQITPDDIEENIGISKDFNVFELQNAFLEKNHKKVFQILNYFEQNPKAGNIVFVINILAKKMSMSPYFVKDFKKGIRNYTLATLQRNIGLLHQYDLKSKGVGNVSIKPNELMKEMAIQLLQE